MGKNKDSQKQQSGSKWDQAYAAVQQARQTNSKVDVKKFEHLTKSAGGKS